MMDLGGDFPQRRPTAVKLTREEIDAKRTPAGTWTRATLAEWGIPWPPPKGWRQALLRGWWK